MSFFTDWFNSLYISEEDLARDREVDAQLAALNQRKLDLGFWTESTYQAAERNRVTSQLNRFLEDEASSPWGGFQEGVQDGANNIARTINGAIAGTAGTIFKALPWWLWLIGALVGGYHLWKLLKA